MEFEWDTNKADSNAKKHGVSFAEAMTVFGDPFELTIQDPDNSSSELRYVSIGLSLAGHLLVVVYTEREGRTRIVSAREAIPKERKQYEFTNPFR